MNPIWQREPEIALSRRIFATATGSLITMGACRLFTSINPIAGAIFYATTRIIEQISADAFKEVFNKDGEGSRASRTIGVCLKHITAIVIGVEVTKALGYAFSMKSAIGVLVLPGGVVLAISLALLVVVVAAVATRLLNQRSNANHNPMNNNFPSIFPRRE